jgi:hypothetical protein
MIENSFESPFEVDLRCNISIEVNVAVRLGDLILKSGTADKQLIALAYKLSNSMVHLVDQLDDKQWENISSHMNKMEEENTPQNFYAVKAQKLSRAIGIKRNVLH